MKERERLPERISPSQSTGEARPPICDGAQATATELV
jgi:hypothetical protein